MKKKYIFLILAVLSLNSVSAQIFGETDMVTRPIDFLKIELKVNTSSNGRPSSPTCNDWGDYSCGYEWGFYDGYEIGLSDANDCEKYKTLAKYAGPGDVSDDFLNGYFAGWYDGYEDGYADRIAEKAAACPTDYVFDELFCECSCTEYRWEYDADGDNYYTQNVAPRFSCTAPSSKWKKFEDLDGIDCNDNDPTIWNYNECGLCTTGSGVTTWYLDGDDDGYHISTTTSCSNPGIGYRLTTLGEDCDDTDPEANVLKTWYYFNDNDTYYGNTTESCLRPTEGTAAKWSPRSKSGEDCDDNNSNVFGPTTWYFDGDGDGYHDPEKTQISCGEPSEGEGISWREITKGADCDDSDPFIYILNACDVCTDDANEVIVAYIDFDGDGYHSAKIELPAHNPDGGIYSTWTGEILDEPRSPCPDQPLIIDMRYFDDNDFFQNEIFNSPLTILYDKTWPEATYFENEIILQEWGVDHILGGSKHNHIENYYRSDVELEYFSRTQGLLYTIFTEYYTLSNGSVLWKQHYWNPWQGTDYIHDQTMAIILSGGFKDDAYNYVRGSTFGLDCNDLDPTLKTESAGNWYFDFDQDGYYDPSVSRQFSTCDISDQKWIRSEDAKGEDCDDSDPEKTIYQNWYLFHDSDDYYGVVEWSCGNPGVGSRLEDHWFTDPRLGLDCDDSDAEAYTDREWYQDKDGDNHYGEVTISCHNPGSTDNEKLTWKTDPGSGLDCDDDDASVTVYQVEVYIDLDSDGYHSVMQLADCGLVNGANIFEGEIIRNSSFPQSLIPATSSEPQEVVVAIPNTALSFTYKTVEDIFEFPFEVVSEASNGEDCDDLNPVGKAEGTWYADLDGDGYHDPTSLSSIGCIQPTENHILLANSLGPDCDDDDPTFNEERTWYKDFDGDGYFVDYVIDCKSPGFGWNLTSTAGADDDDANPFSPHYTDEDFIIPSLLTTEVVDDVTYVNYLGEQYLLDQFSIIYRGVELKFEDLFFDRVTPENRLIANALLSSREVAIYDVQIVTTIDGVSSSTTLGDAVESELKTDPTEWIQEKIDNNSLGYSVSFGSASFGDINNPGSFNQDASAYYDELFDVTKFSSFKSHYLNHGGTAFTLTIQTFEEDLTEDGETEILNEKFGDKEVADVAMMAKKFLDGRVEFVIFIKDDEFKATPEQLKAVKGLDENGDPVYWVNESGLWINPADEQTYLNQQGKIKSFRQVIPLILSVDYLNSTQIPDNYTIETIPEYLANWGVLNKWAEALEINYHLSHYFELPQGIWNNSGGVAATTTQIPGEPIQSSSAVTNPDKWKANSYASVAGLIDGSFTSVDGIADVTNLAMSLTLKRSWEHTLRVTTGFDIAEKTTEVTPTFLGLFPNINGVPGSREQMYDIGRMTSLILQTLEEWDADIQPSSPSLGAEKGSPVNSLITKYDGFTQFGATIGPWECWNRAWDRAKEIHEKYDQFEIFAFLLELALCETEKQNCGADNDLEAYSCGVSNALLEEVNWIVLLELIDADYSSVPADFFDCIIDEFKFGIGTDDEVRYKAIWRCTIGGTPEELIAEISTFISENWDDPYTQGQATVFAVTLLSPFKAKILTQAKKLPAFVGKAKKLDELAMATRADELVAISKFSTRLDNPTFTVLRNQLDELEVATRTKFFQDFANVPDDILETLQDGDLLDSWRALDNAGVDEIIRRNPDYLKNMDDYSVRSGKTHDEIADLAKTNENGVEQFFDELEDTPSSGYWDENPFQRGRNIEDDLGQNLPETFKTIDKYDFGGSGKATSIKSLDLDAKTYQTASRLRSRLNKYVDELDNFTGHTQEGINIGGLDNPILSKELELAIPRAATGDQLNVINEVISNAAAKGINFNVVVFP